MSNDKPKLTPRQQEIFELIQRAIARLLQQLLGMPQPVYRHHRLIEDSSGHKLSKSTQATALRELRGHGVTPAEIRSLVGLPDDSRNTTGGC